MKQGDKGANNFKSDHVPDQNKNMPRVELYEIDQVEKKLVELMNDGVFIAQDFRFIYANPALKAMLNYQPDELFGSNFESVVADEFLEIWLERYKKRIGTGQEPPGRYELQFLRKGGVERIWLELQAKRIQYKGKAAVLGVVRDISKFKEVQAELEALSQTDKLTGLANRNRLMDLLDMGIKSATRRKEKVAVMFLDLDAFKQINDTLGHDAGDYLLKESAARLLKLVRNVDTVGRLGGDEFVVILDNINSHDDSRKVAEKILKQFSLPYKYEDKKMEISASIGISHYPDDGDDCESLLRKADKAMYHVKKTGKCNYRIYGVDT